MPTNVLHVPVRLPHVPTNVLDVKIVRVLGVRSHVLGVLDAVFAVRSSRL